MASGRRAEELCEYINIKSAKVSDKDDAASSEQAATNNGKIFRVSSACYDNSYNYSGLGCCKLVNYYQTKLISKFLCIKYTESNNVCLACMPQN